MSSNRILQPGEIASFSAEIPRLLRPDAQLFATRAERLRRIALGPDSRIESGMRK